MMAELFVLAKRSLLGLLQKKQSLPFVQFAMASVPAHGAVEEANASRNKALKIRAHESSECLSPKPCEWLPA